MPINSADLNKPARPVKTRRTVAEILGNFRFKPNNITKQTRTDARKQYFWFLRLRKKQTEKLSISKKISLNTSFWCRILFFCFWFFPSFYLLLVSDFLYFLSSALSLLFLVLSDSLLVFPALYISFSSPVLPVPNPFYIQLIILFLDHCTDPLLLFKKSENFPLQ